MTKRPAASHNDPEGHVFDTAQQHPLKKVLIVDRFDRIPGIKYLTIGGNHVQIVHNDLSFSGWALPNLESNKDEVSQAGALSHYIPVGQRIFLPSKDIKRLVDSADKPQQANMVLSLRPQNHNILISDDSIWTVDPNEPFIQETPFQYDLNRKIYLVFFIITVLLGLSVLTLMNYFIFGYAGGILLNESSIVLEDNDLLIEDRTLKYSSIHGLVTTLTTFMVTCTGVLLFRTFPSVKKLKLKYIHAACGFIGMLGCIGATILSIYSHKINNVVNFFSLHGFIGIFAMGCYCIQWTSGFVTLCLPFTSFKFRANFVPLHKFFGLVVLLLVLPSMVTGVVVYTKLNIELKVHVRLPPKSMVLNFTGLLILIFGLLLTFLLADHRFRRRPRPLPHLVKETSLVAITQDLEQKKSTLSGTGDSVTTDLVVSG